LGVRIVKERIDTEERREQEWDQTLEQWPVLDEEWSCLHDLLDPKQIHYCNYINLKTLIGLGKPNLGTENQRDCVHPDEPQFIAVHQIIEIGFRNQIITLCQLIDKMKANNFQEAIMFAKRLELWCQANAAVMMVLTTMKQKRFSEFRNNLSSASGVESEQFRIIEILSGIEPDDDYATIRGEKFTFQAFLDRTPEPGSRKPKSRLWTKRLAVLSKGSTVRKVFDEKVTDLGLKVQDLIGNNRDKTSSIVPLAEALVRYDKSFQLNLRQRHRRVAEQNIGKKEGTGNTDGVAYLKSTRRVKFFPDLWNDGK